MRGKSVKHPREGAKIVQALGTQAKQDFQHPLRHPGYTFLDALGVASLGAGTGARVGAVGRAIRTGENVGRAVADVSRPKSLVMRAHGLEASRPAPRSVLMRSVANGVNDLRNRFPDAHIGVRTQTQRVGKQIAKNRALDFKIRTAPAVSLVYEGKKISVHSPKGMAMRAVAEGTPLETMQQAMHGWIADAKRVIAGPAKTKADRRRIADARYALKNLPKQIALAEKAKRFVTPDLKFIDPKLAELYARTEKVALEADQRIAAAGAAPSDVLAEAIHKPGRVYRGQPLTAEDVAAHAQQLRHAVRQGLDVPLGVESGGGLGPLPGDVFQGGRFHVGQKTRRSPFSSQRPPALGNPYVVNTGKAAPSRLTHVLTGAAQKSGRLRHDVPRIVAENVMESERHAAILRAGKQLYAVAHDTPEGLKHPVAIKAPEMLGQGLPQAIRDAQDAYKTGRQLNEKQTNLLGLAYDTVRERLFPNIEYNPEAWPTVKDLPEYEGIRWIERDLLGGLNEPGPLASTLATKGGRASFAFIDTVNNATKTAYLYLKPAYVTPNVAGNVFLTLTQQGWAAPRNIAQASRMMRKLGPEDTRLVDSLMGEGISSAIHSEGGALAGVMNKFATGYGKVIDVPFRRASFIYEARREFGRGAKWQEIKSLLHDEGKRPQLEQVTERANRALIEYGDLTPWERALIRRVLFFYPWLKGSTRYAKDYLSDHPQQAALLATLGQYGNEKATADLGARPSWAQGLFKVGGTENMPLTVNPAAAGILSQPAQIAAVAANFLRPGGHVKPGYALRQLLTPALGGGGASVFGVDDFGNPVEPNVGTFGSSLYPSIPALLLWQRLHGKTSKTYPMTPEQALLQFLIGGIAPRTTNRPALNQSAKRERKPTR